MSENKLKKYGFSEYYIGLLLKGKVVTVPYGKVKFNKNTNTLFTYYTNGIIKEKQL